MNVSTLSFWWSGKFWYVHFKGDLPKAPGALRKRIACGCGPTKIDAIEELRALKAAERTRAQK